MCTKMIVVVLFLCLVQALATPRMGMMGGGMMGGMGANFAAVKAFATFNKQLGMSQALLGKGAKAAQNEVKLELDALKAAAKAAPAGDPCGAAAEAAATAIDNELLTAFDRCAMKDEIQGLRLQAMSLKTQMAAMKMAKKACKLELDPAQCLADANAGATDNVAGVSDGVNTGMTDVLTKANDCIEEVKTALLQQVEDAADDLLAC